MSFRDWSKVTFRASARVDRRALAGFSAHYLGRPEVLEQRALLAPVVNALGIAPLANVEFSGDVATFTATGTDLDPTDFAATIQWTPTGPVTNGEITQDGSTFRVAGSHTYDKVGPFVTKITVYQLSDASSASDEGVAIVREPALAATGQNINAFVGVPFTGTVATFTDTNVDSQPGDFTAKIRWGDSDAQDDGVVSFAPGGGFQVRGTHTYSSIGTLPLRVTITRTGTAQAVTTSSSATVVLERKLTASGATIDATSGVEFTEFVATFRDTDPTSVPGDFTARVSWGDSQPATFGTIEGNPAGGFRAKATHTYDSAGAYPLEVTITRTSPSESVTAKGVVNVASTAPEVVATTFPAVANTEGYYTVANFTVPNVVETKGGFAASIKWGDGSPDSVGVIDGANGVFTVRGTHTYTQSRTTSTTVTVYRISDSQSGTDRGLAIVASQPAVGGLDPNSASGAGVTKSRQPRLSGFAEPYSLIQVYSTRPDLAGARYLGQTIANGDGTWSLVVGPLADAVYQPFVTATPPNGTPLTTVAMTGFQVDATRPGVKSVVRQKRTGRLEVTLQDAGSGVDVESIRAATRPTGKSVPGALKVPVSWKRSGIRARVVSSDAASGQVTLAFWSTRSPLRSISRIATLIRDRAGNSLVV